MKYRYIVSLKNKLKFKETNVKIGIFIVIEIRHTFKKQQQTVLIELEEAISSRPSHQDPFCKHQDL